MTAGQASGLSSKLGQCPPPLGTLFAHTNAVVLLLSIASGVRWVILGVRPRMIRPGSLLLAGLLFVVTSAQAQSDDPSETFLKAYMTAQQGEKLERDNQFTRALAKYRLAGSLLEELKKTHSEWQPAIVEYRSRKVSESILRVQGKSGTQQDLAATNAPPAEAQPSPQRSTEPTVEVGPGKSKPSIIVQPAGEASSPPKAREAAAEAPVPVPAPAVNDNAIKNATRKLRDKVDQLEAELQHSRSKVSEVEEEKEKLNSKLKESNSKLEQAQHELERTKDAEKNVRGQLAEAQASLKKGQESGNADVKAQEALKGQIAQLKQALASAEEGRATAEKERDSQSAKLAEANSQIVEVTKERDSQNAKLADANSQIAQVTKERDSQNAKLADANSQIAQISKERDDALGQLAGLKDSEHRVAVLLAENTELKEKLATAENAVREVSEDKPKKEQELADARKQLEDLRAQLEASQKQNKDFEVAVASLRSQLEDTSSQLEKAKLTGANSEETAKLTHENQILRNIVVRERQEEARREQAKKLMLAEFDKLKIKSDTLNEQIALLAQPATKLTDEELALLRQPVISISDESPNTVKASFTYAKPSTGSQPGEPVVETTESATPPEANLQSGFKPNVPTDLLDVARQAKENFDNGKYHAAERQYQELLTKSPNNLYSLSNLGVVYFRTGKLKAAELTLKKAVAIAPKDEFAHTTLGIVYYRQSKFDDALNELTKSLAINPKSAAAHNYLGITASQKGWQEAAEKEMLEAIAVKPDYADAHFNLAVIYATASPPSKELAKRHYAKATELGAQPDASLEKLLR
jgi:Flp pilus assembly protein TadD/septal ring factor EnvC (AmiA/AmiB activator)